MVRQTVGLILFLLESAGGGSAIWKTPQLYPLQSGKYGGSP